MPYNHSMECSCTLNGYTTVVRSSSLAEIVTDDEHRIFITDENVAHLLPSSATDAILVLPAGEAHKRWESIERIITFALDHGLGRDSVFIGIGGGVICDMAAFAASIYMRGVEVELVPTTLLSMVDASVGGKTGADFTKVKNIIGTFHPARTVHICTDTLFALSDAEYLNGLAEVIKHGLLEGGELLSIVSEHIDALKGRRDREMMERMIFDSILVKKHFIEADPKEQLGQRAKLNLGHTFGHALETISGLSTWSHGAAVAWGVVRAAEAAEIMGFNDHAYVAFVTALYRDYGFDIDYRIAEGELDEYLRVVSHDKKKRSGTVQFILQRGVGDTFLTPVPQETIAQVVSTSRR